MSLQSSMAVMKAKLAGNEMQLKALAAQGDMEAAAALKEMLDAKQMQSNIRNNDALQNEEQPSVLDQMSMPQSGLAAYAGGGRVRNFQAGGVPAFEMYTDSMPRNMKPLYAASRAAPEEAAAAGPGFLDREGSDAPSWLADLVKWYTQADEPKAPKVSPEYDDRKRLAALHPPVGKVSQVPGKSTPRTQSGLAPVMEESVGRHNTRIPAPEKMPDLPVPEDLSDKELTDVLAKLEPLQKKRDLLRSKSREQLEEMYNATVKANSPSVWQKLGEMGAAMAAKGGSSAWAALGAGGKAAMDSEKARQQTLLAAKAAYQKADMLEQDAQVRDEMGDIQGAHKMRQEAAALRKQLAAQKSTEKLQASQADYYDAQADYTRSTKPAVEQMKAQAAATRAGRTGSGSGLGAGAKPPNPVQLERAIQSRTAQFMRDDPFMDKDKARAQAEAEVRASVAKSMGSAASPASPAGPTVKFLGFE